MIDPLALQAKKNALGNLAMQSTSSGPMANDLTAPAQTGIGGVKFSNPNTFGLPSTQITNMDRSKIDPSYQKRNRFGISKLFTKTPKPPKAP